MDFEITRFDYSYMYLRETGMMIAFTSFSEKKNIKLLSVESALSVVKVKLETIS